MLLKADANQPAYEDLARALESDPHDTAALDGLIRAAAALNKIYDVQSRLSKLAAAPAHKAAQLALSRVLASQGNIEAAGPNSRSTNCRPTPPTSRPSNNWRRSCPTSATPAASNRSFSGWSRRRRRARGRTITRLHCFSYRAGSRPRSRLRATPSSIDATNAKAHNLIGACLASLGQTDAARTAFETSIKADPREPGTYANLGTLELQAANRDRAAKYFTEALTIDPSNQVARDGIATITKP